MIERQNTEDPRRHAPATERNREPILAALRALLPKDAYVLEIASGTGQHAVYFAAGLPGVTWQPSDPDPENRASIAAWAAAEKAEHVAPPLPITADVPASWKTAGDPDYDAVFCANMIHIAPWSATLGVLAGSAALLKPGGHVILYGPFKIDGAHTSDSNVEFDASLKARDPAWGVRDLRDVSREADKAGLRFERRLQMPANNLLVVFSKPLT